MLMESVSDPRRANWLTLGGTCDDIYWPEERPSWELEAEILRLTTRLMMRERELRQVKNQMKAQASRNQQQLSTWRRRMEEKEEQMRMLLVEKDAEMQSIVSQLLLFEAELRQEQARIEGLLAQKDAQISRQQQELDKLRVADTSRDESEADLESPYSNDGLVKTRAIQDVTNVHSVQERTSETEKKRILNRSPQKMKDLKAKRINSHKIHRQAVL